MAIDPKARKVSIGYAGGSISASRGLLEAMFGEELVQVNTGTPVAVSRDSHSRTRVIGGPSTAVAGANFSIGQYPASRSNGGSGGEPILVNLDGNWWTLRLSGSHQALAAFMSNATWASGKTLMFKSEKGSTYGPFSSN